MLKKPSQEPLDQFQPNLIGNNSWEFGIQICSNKGVASLGPNNA